MCLLPKPAEKAAVIEKIKMEKAMWTQNTHVTEDKHSTPRSHYWHFQVKLVSLFTVHWEEKNISMDKRHIFTS